MMSANSETSSDSAKVAHLGMIQSVVNRLAQNSFYYKGWSVVLSSALFALAANDARIHFVLVAYFPAIAFWCLDGFYLALERRFRDHYDKVRLLPEANVDFSMSTKPICLSSWADATLSKSVWPLHVLIIAAIVMATIVTLQIQPLTGGQ